MLDRLDAAAVRRWSRSALAGLAAARAEIDALNVYPVPDADTGTNLYLTMQAATAEVARLPPGASLAATVSALAHGALVGARGNSGLILGQLVRGMATTLADPPAVVDGTVLAAGLRRAAELGYAAVARPVEGTMLTVARAAADAAGAAGPALDRVAAAAAAAAREALAATPAQLDVLRQAGVVDAGGRGLTVLLDALVAVVAGEPARPLPDGTVPASPAEAAVGSAPPRCATVGAPAYEVTYLLDAPDSAIPALSATLDRLGDSVVVGGGAGLWSVHVHLDDAGAAVEAGMSAGRPHRIRVEALPGPAAAAGREDRRTGRGVICVVAGPGLADLAAGAGAVPVVGGPGRRPGPEDLLQAIRQTTAEEVAVLPNDPVTREAAEQAAARARGEGQRVAVVPALATVQALAALAVHDPQRRFDEDVVAMTAAASHTRHGAVTVADRDAVTAAGPCRRGDVLGVVDGDFAVVGEDLAGVATAVLDRLLAGGGEIVTVVVGAGVAPEVVERAVDHARRGRPEVDVVVLDGGQRRYPLLLGVE